MKVRPSIKATLWMLPGALLMLLLVLAAIHFQDRQSPSEQLISKARRADLVSRIQLALASASEAEKNALMASADDSKAFAEQARTATARAQLAFQDLEAMMRSGGTQGERNLLGQFGQAFAEFRRLNGELLTLAVKDTNRRAYSLAFGPATDAVEQMRAALSRILAASAGSPKAATITLLALRAQTGALRAQTLLAPHIAEESDEKMDELEAAMSREDAQVEDALAGLAALPALSRNAELAAARASYARFRKTKAEILALSRENTNVRSFALSLHQERKVVLLCQDALSALKQAILDEPVRGVTHEPVRPR